MLREKPTTTRATVKKTVNADDARRKREESAASIRKSKREESLSKRREVNEPSWALAHTQQLEQQQPEILTNVTAAVERLSEYVQLAAVDNQNTITGVVGLRKLLSIGKFFLH